MINIRKQNGKLSYGIEDLVLDTADDITNLPTDIAVGSTAFVIETSKKYMLNSSKEWKEINI